MNYNGMVIKPVFKPIVNDKPTAPIPMEDMKNHIIGWNELHVGTYVLEELGEYMTDTGDLISYYKSNDCFDGDNIRLQKLADYGGKYGIPLGNGKGNEVSLLGLCQCFENVVAIIDIFKAREMRQEIIDKLCKALVGAIKHEQSKGEKGDYDFIFMSPIEKEFAEGINAYITVVEDEKYVSIIYNCADNDYYKNITYPIIRIKCNASDLTTLEDGSYAEKINFIKGRILEGVSGLLNTNKPEIRITVDSKGVPVIEMLTDNHLVYFLITVLTNSNFNYCANPNCNKLLTNGNKYCSGGKCMQATVKSSPVAKLKRMIGNWGTRGVRTLSPNESQVLEDKGKELLKYMKYEDVVKELQLMRMEMLVTKE